MNWIEIWGLRPWVKVAVDGCRVLCVVVFLGVGNAVFGHGRAMMSLEGKNLEHGSVEGPCVVRV